MKKSIFIILGFCALVSLTGCNDEAFLKENPKYFYTPDNIFTTSAQVDQVLVACYSHIRQMYCVEENTTSRVFRGNSGTDMFDVAKFREGIRFNDYGNINPEHTVFDTNFKQWYMLISKANLAMYAVSLKDIVWASEQEKAYAVAQAKFFRAWAYRNLGELYGGVPIVKEIVAAPRYDFERKTRVETYQFAIEDLETSLNDFPETSSQPGRIVKGAALHCLAQLYLDLGLALEEQNKVSDAKIAYETSVDYANQLIDEGSIYSLMKERFGVRKNEGPVYYFANKVDDQNPEHKYSAAGVNIEGNVFWDMFQTGNTDYQHGNKESIWTIQANFDAYVAEDASAGFNFSRTYGPVFRDGESNKYLTGSMEDVGGHGVCMVMPTFYTRDVVYEGKWNKDMRNTDAVFRRTFIGNVPGTEWYGKVIPWDVLYCKNGTQDQRDQEETRHYPISCKISSDYYPDVANGASRTMLFRNQYIIRLAETILVRAEAKMRAGDMEGAAADINMIRDRAKCDYKVVPSDVNVDLILDERARELVYEECRWNTLLRMGGTVAVERIKKYSHWDYPRITLTKEFNLWPIPQKVIDSNKDVKIEQNPGWN